MDILLNIFIGLLILSLLIFFIEINRYNQIVLKHSKLLVELEEVNKAFVFKDDFKDHYRYTERVEYKSKLDRFDFESYLLYKSENDKIFFEELISKIDFNLSLHKKYQQKLLNLKSSFNQEDAKKFFVSLKRLIAVENKYYQKKIIKPQLETEIEIYVRYTSPRGRNSYYRNATYPFYEIKNFYHQMLLLKEKRSTRSYQMKVERIKMTATMRYEVLVRDKSTCQICGVSKKEGAVLHVDHIVPVAKGGKSTLNNLRTLCDRCNLGKKDRLEEPA